MNGASSFFRRTGEDSKRQSNSNTARPCGSPVKAVIFGLLAAIVTCGLILVIASMIMSKSDISAEYASITANIAITVSTLAGGAFAARIYRKRGLYIGTLTGLIYYALLMLTGLIFFKSGPSVTALTKLIMMTAAGAIGGITGINLFKRKRKY